MSCDMTLCALRALGRPTGLSRSLPAARRRAPSGGCRRAQRNGLPARDWQCPGRRGGTAVQTALAAPPAPHGARCLEPACMQRERAIPLGVACVGAAEERCAQLRARLAARGGDALGRFTRFLSFRAEPRRGSRGLQMRRVVRLDQLRDEEKGAHDGEHKRNEPYVEADKHLRGGTACGRHALACRETHALEEGKGTDRAPSLSGRVLKVLHFPAREGSVRPAQW
jgi:hypothetical protein